MVVLCLWMVYRTELICLRVDIVLLRSIHRRQFAYFLNSVPSRAIALTLLFGIVPLHDILAFLEEGVAATGPHLTILHYRILL